MDSLHDTMLKLVKAALAEDIGCGDLTSMGCLEPNPAKASIVAKSSGIISGIEPLIFVFKTVDSANRLKLFKRDGDSFSAGDTILEIEGFNLTILASERTALNFLGHLSGIATMTRRFVEKIRDYATCRILDTRKTTPGWRLLEKMAVVHGGGVNHRTGLYDMVLVKDNHIASAGSIKDAVARMREFLQSREFRQQFQLEPEKILVEVEITSELELTEAIESKVDRLLLDNQTPESLRVLVALARRLDPGVKLEASGNVSLDNVAAIAASGVDFISIGAITHSAPVSDFSLRIVG
jgi:nicotinate-nucleotide pyrophosphorylase (carboxylating)